MSKRYARCLWCIQIDSRLLRSDYCVSVLKMRMISGTLRIIRQMQDPEAEDYMKCSLNNTGLKVL